VADTGGIERRLRDALKQSLRARDGAAVAALRSALAAIDNAGAVEVAQTPPAAGDEHVAGSLAGVGVAEVERRELTEPELIALVRAEVPERQVGAGEYERHGHGGRAERLRHEAAVLSGVLATTN
jgi:hypothetical protein